MCRPIDTFAQREKKKLSCPHSHWTIRCSACERLCASEITAQDWLDVRSAIAYLESQGYTTKKQDLPRNTDIPSDF